MKANLDEAFSSGRVKAGLEAVSLEDWKKAATDKGINRISVGIDAVSAKQVDMAGRLLSAVDTERNKVNAMPDMTIDDSVARASAFMRGMAKYKGKI
jgi:hypothetical protein